MPTQFRWLWYLVGLAGLALAIVGLLAMIGSIVNDGLILPFLGLAAVGLGYVAARYRRRPRPAATGGVPSVAADPTAAPTANPDTTTSADARGADPGRTSRR
jgi:hypothetical protein